MPIKVYQSKRNKKLYEVYVSIKSKGERLTNKKKKGFSRKLYFFSSIAKKIEFELKARA